MRKTKAFVGMALALGSALAAGMAQAGERDRVQWTIALGAPGFSQVTPAYRPPVVAYAQGPYRRPTRWDRDGDGIPDRRDRLYNPAWDRDGDGIANRYDRHDDSRRVHGSDPRRHERDAGPGWQRRP
jgi:hypothetical protein